MAVTAASLCCELTIPAHGRHKWKRSSDDYYVQHFPHLPPDTGWIGIRLADHAAALIRSMSPVSKRTKATLRRSGCVSASRASSAA